jgi:Ca2+-binding RTX toxin-like protein
MAQISAGYETLDMTSWVFPVLNALHRVADSDPSWVKLSADDNDPFGHASYNHDAFTIYVRLIGTAFGDFDTKGVPHSGVVHEAVLFTASNALAPQFSGLSLSVNDVLAALGSQSPSQLTTLLNPGDDTLYGLGRDVGRNSIDPLGDHLLGGPGNDSIFGHGGHDTLEGGAGDDVIHTVDSHTEEGWGAKSSVVDGGQGHDTISYQDAPFGVAVDLSGGAGTDTVSNVEVAMGSGFSDTMSGSTAADTLFGGGGDDHLDGGDGADYLRGDAGSDRYVGGTGADVIDADVGDQSVDAGAGDDLVIISKAAAGEAVRLTALALGDGDDQVVFNATAGLSMTVDGGAGANRVEFNPGDAATVDVYLNQAHSGSGLVLTGVTQINAQYGAPAMHLVGGDQAETISGGGNADVIDGGGGNDYLAENLAPTGIGKPETITGGAGDDTIAGAGGANFLTGGDGADYIIGGFGFDRTNGNAGNDTVNGSLGDDWVTGGRDDDRLAGDVGSDILNGNLGNDTADGGDGADVVRGGQGDDLLFGGNGDDYLTGDLGDDELWGGAGADVFRAFAGGGHDVINDFNPAEGDRILFDPGTQHTETQVGTDVVVDLGGGSLLVLKFTTLAGLGSGWIVAG